jgi:hypothetical protein
MIVYDLKCSQEHVFEGWFKNGEAFEEQKARGLLTCPLCQDTRIEKVFSAPSIKRNAEGEVGVPMEALARKLYQYLDKNFEDVGTEFAKEALKIHYGVGEKRNIKGSTTESEETLLKTEGVPYLKIPVPKPETSH